MKVALFAEYLNDNYFRALYSLDKGKQIKLSKFTLGLLQQIRIYNKEKNKIKSKSRNSDEQIVRKEHSFTSKLINLFNTEDLKHDILLYPFRLLNVLKSNVIIIACSPYFYLIYVAFAFIIFRKKIMFSTSWPHWSNKKTPYKGSRISRKLWKLFMKGRLVHVVNNAAAKEVKKLGSTPVHIPHAVDTKIFKPNHILHKGVRVLFIGRLEEEKGILVLIEAIRDLKNHPVELWIAGSGSLKQRILSLNENFPIKFKGFVNNKEELNEIYNSCDILVNASYSTSKWEELFGITIVEGMSCGLPVVASDCIGPSEIIKNGINGYLFKQKDVRGLSQILDRLIIDSRLRTKIGRQGRIDVEKYYDLKVIEKKWMKMLSRIN